jgi:hypothetical protein
MAKLIQITKRHRRLKMAIDTSREESEGITSFSLDVGQSITFAYDTPVFRDNKIEIWKDDAHLKRTGDNQFEFCLSGLGQKRKMGTLTLP